MEVKLATTDTEILACFAVMKELRTHLDRDQFCCRIRQQQDDGYNLAYIIEKNIVVAVAGFRKGVNLVWGSYVYIDDLITAEVSRSKGHGKALLDYVKAYANSNGCEQLHLDSGVKRKSAHKFYQREGLFVTSAHFAYLISSSENNK